MQTATRIDRESPLPFYWQLKQLIVVDINVRGLQPGDRLPGDMELCERYDVSRTVVRQALTDLEHEGIIRREKGRGTFVSDPRTARGIGGTLSGTFEDIQGQAGEQRSHVIHKAVVRASDEIGRDLQLRAGADVVEIERVREVDGVPWAFTRTQLPLDIGSGLLDIELEDISLFGVLEQRFGIRFERARRTVQAEDADRVVASMLRTSVGASLLVLRSVSFDRAGRPIERFAGFHRGDRSRLDVDVSHALDSA